jgi:hypothetical protein
MTRLLMSVIATACSAGVGAYVLWRVRHAARPHWEGMVVRKWIRRADNVHIVDIRDGHSERPHEIAASVWTAVRPGDRLIMERGATEPRITPHLHGPG